MIDTLRRDLLRLEEENTVMVHQIVDLSKGLQEAKDSKAEARMLRRQRMQMFRGFSVRLMEVAHRLGIDRLNLPTIPEDDRSILHFFGQLADKLADALAKVAELINTECRELLGLAGTRIFSNIQRLRPHRLALSTALCRTEPPSWTSLSSACRSSTPTQEHLRPQDRRAPPAVTRRAPGKPAVKKPLKPTTTERRSLAERRPQGLAKTLAMSRTPRKMPRKLPF
jgi:acetolactate synthase regulatory subunit